MNNSAFLPKGSLCERWRQKLIETVYLLKHFQFYYYSNKSICISITFVLVKPEIFKSSSLLKKSYESLLLRS